MQLYDFIFSDSWRYKLLRHISFWLMWIIFSSFVQLTSIAPDTVSTYFFVTTLILKAVERVPFQIIFCYFFTYLILPRFLLKRKYKNAGWYLLLSLFLLYWLTYFFLTPLFTYNFIRVGLKPPTPFIKYFYSFYSNANFTGVIPALCFMLAIKYYKNWYVKQKQSQALLQENAQAELQLLKAQVHPHFLFNTLNNIYSYTLTQHPSAADLVDKLSGMIDYMCTDGYKELVPLEKEIQLINDYIELEKVRYGSRLNLDVDIHGKFDDKYIAPLLMIPFVENCFKHGAGKLRGNQWIELSINISDNQLNFYLANSKQDEETKSDKKGIGLANVQKRLQLLYPSHHIFNCQSTDTMYSVKLQVLLSEKEPVSENNLSIQYQPALYA